MVAVTALLCGQAARLLSLATSQCAAAMGLENIVHPVAVLEVLVVLVCMWAWSDWPQASGFVAALCAGFTLRGGLALTLERRWVRQH